MLIVLLVLQFLILLVLIALLLRKQVVAAPDPRTAQLPDSIARLDARGDASDAHIRAAFGQMREEIAAEARRTRDASGADFGALRTEITGSITTLGSTLHTGLDAFRTDNAVSSDKLRHAVQQQMDAIGQRLVSFTSESTKTQLEAREALHTRLTGLADSNAHQQDKLRAVVEDRLEKLNTTNAAKLEEMRVTVDEKLHATLHTRLTESFGQVSDQLNKVHSGLGEMTKLSDGVSDLSRIFTNVKSRGGFAEVQLGMLLEQMLAPSQFVRNAKVKPNTQELVEFAIRFPGQNGETLLPIDAKFPREAWERLENAYETKNIEAVTEAGKGFEAAIRAEGKRICGKYINPPITTPHAIMFLPTEGLYAEVMRRDSLQAEIQSKCQVTIAGPSTLSAILTSFQMGFHMLALQKKGGEVWKVLESAKTEFGKFEKLMDKMEGDVGKIHKAFGEVGVRSRAITRTLREVTETETGSQTNLIPFEGLSGVAPLLAAVGEDD